MIDVVRTQKKLILTALLGVIFLGSGARADALGSWGPVVQFKDNVTPSHVPNRPMPDGGWWVTPIHGTALTDGRVLLSGWGRYAFDHCTDPTFKEPETRQNGESWILDPLSLAPGASPTLMLSPISEDGKGKDDVLYCAGNVTLADGRVFMMGGARYVDLGGVTAYAPAGGPTMSATEEEYGLPYFRLFDPSTQKFTRYEKAPHGSPAADTQPRLLGDVANWYQEGMMWYPTETRLPGGRVLVAGGFTRNCGANGSCENNDLEIFDPSQISSDPWSTWVSAQHSSSYDPGMKDYSHTFLLYSAMPAEIGEGIPRQVIVMGWPGSINGVSLDPTIAPNQRLVETKFSRPKGALAWDSTAAMLGTGEILIMGGGSDPRGESQRIDLFDPQTGMWRSKDTGITRHNASSTLLPDGTVLIVNGEAGIDTGPDVDRLKIGDRHSAQIYDPFTDELTTLPPWADTNVNDRGYHNLSLLLKSGQILTGGGMVTLAEVGCERPDARLFNPPYYRPGNRPALKDFDEHRTFAYGETIDVRYDGASLSPRVARASAAGIPTGVGRSGVVLMAVGSETHSFDQNQRYVPLDFDVLGGGRIRIHAPANSTLAPEGDYFLFLVDKSGAVSPGVHVRVGTKSSSFMRRFLDDLMSL